MMMKTVREVCRFVVGCWCAAAVGLALTAGNNAFGGNVHIDVLKTRTDTFTNVTVYGMSRTDIFIRHAQGIGNVKTKNLDQETLVRLGLVSATNRASGSSKKSAFGSQDESSSGFGGATASGLMSGSDGESRRKLPPGLAMVSAMCPVRLGPVASLAVVGLLLGVYLFFCYCLKLICVKTGNEPGPMVWLPILQMFPMLRAAGMSAAWFLAFLMPVLNLVAPIVWSFKIVHARGKSVWVAICLLLPFTSLVAFLYLAFSSAENSNTDETVRVVTPPVLAEA